MQLLLQGCAPPSSRPRGVSRFGTLRIAGLVTARSLGTTSMDYTLPALKTLVAQLKAWVQPNPTATVHTVGALRFQRVWIQGVLVAGPTHEGRFVLDDGTGVVHLSFTVANQRNATTWKPGMYVLVVGAYQSNFDYPLVYVHKIVDLSASPDREAAWHLEVIEAHNTFYENKIKGSA